MTQYNSVNVRLSNSQLDELKSAIKNETGGTLQLSLYTIRTSKNDFLDNLLLTIQQVPSLCKAFANHSSANTKLLKNQLSKIIQSSGFLGSIFGPLAKMMIYSY